MKWNNSIKCLSLLFTLFAISCSEESSNSNLHIVDIEKSLTNEQPALLSEYVSDLEYIPIETNSDFLISDLWGFTANDNFIAFCCKKTKQVYQISTDGKLIRKVGQQGRGENEYVAVAKLYSNAESIIVFFGRKIIYYSARTGEIQKIITPDNFADIKNFTGFSQYGKDSLIILSTKGQENYLAIINNESTQLETKRLWDTEKRRVNMTLPNGKTQLVDWSYTSTLYNFDDNTRATKDFVDTIFTYTDGNLNPYAVFNYGRLDDKRFDPVLNLETAFEGHGVKETKNLILFNTIMKEAAYIYNKETKETRRIKKFDNSNYQGFTNDIDNGLPFWPVAVTSDRMYSFLSADVFIEEAAKSNSERMKEVAATITEESNPVIIVATLK